MHLREAEDLVVDQEGGRQEEEGDWEDDAHFISKVKCNILHFIYILYKYWAADKINWKLSKMGEIDFKIVILVRELKVVRLMCCHWSAN